VRAVSKAAEPRYLVAFAELITELEPDRSAGGAMTEVLAQAQADECLGCFVIAYRAKPALLGAAAEHPKGRLISTPAIVRAKDIFLANKYGFAIRDNASPPPAQLSPRERDVYALMIRGCSNAEIAAALVISVSTAKVHVHRILQKLGYRSRIDAVVSAPTVKRR
jgi:ATP/maltotriose-dependent transcriptional regulator MalT